MLDDITQDRLLKRIGLTDRPAPDATGLHVVHRAFVSHVPYEDLAVQLGEYEPLDPVALVKRVLRGGRGGYCFEANTVLQSLLEALGFAVERRQGIVGAQDAHGAGAQDAHGAGAPTNHLALVVDTPDAGPFIAEAGWGEGPLDPLPLCEGSVRAGLFTFRIERVSDGWWVGQHEFGSSAGFWFGDASATLADFQSHHERLSTSPDSSFVQTLIVQQPFDDRIVTLRACTLSSDGPGRRDRQVVRSSAAFASVLGHVFGIDPEVLGPARLRRLWAKAADQHEAHRASTESP